MTKQPTECEYTNAFYLAQFRKFQYQWNRSMTVEAELVEKHANTETRVEALEQGREQDCAKVGGVLLTIDVLLQENKELKKELSEFKQFVTEENAQLRLKVEENAQLRLKVEELTSRLDKAASVIAKLTKAQTT